MPTQTSYSDLVSPALKAEFHLALGQSERDSFAGRVATVLDVRQPIVRYPWLSAGPGMREFVDERATTRLDAHDVSIEDKTFEATLEVPRRALEDDALGLIRLRVRELALRVAAHKSQMVAQALVDGTNVIGYDGISLLSDDHPVGGSNVSGDGLTADAVASAMVAMMKRPDDAGQPLGIRPDTLLVGPDLQFTASELIESPVVVARGGGYTDFRNALHGALRLEVSPWIPDGQWYLLDTSRPMRSVILQQRADVPIEFAALDGPKSEAAFWRDVAVYGVRARYNVCPGLWQTVFGGGRA